MRRAVVIILFMLSPACEADEGEGEPDVRVPLPPPSRAETTVPPVPESKVEVPNVVGLAREEAIATVNRAGLRASYRGGDAHVVRQQPQAGEIVPALTTVELTTAERE